MNARAFCAIVFGMKLGDDPPSALVLSSLERMVLVAFAERLGAVPALVEQVRRARVARRTHSGVGFVTRIEVPADAPAVAGAHASAAAAVHATHPALSVPAEFLVQIRQGRIASIEAFCENGMWPADDAGFRIVARSTGHA